jgi:YD repeat-containing protein
MPAGSRRSTTTFALILCLAQIGFVQSTAAQENDAVRVTMSVNPDGSRTVYKFDGAAHKAAATTTDPDGKVREKIRYQLDDAGRFSSGLIFGPDGRLRLKSRYKYDSEGRLEEETQMNEKDAVLHKIVYSYDQAGKRSGYSIFDPAGKLVGKTSSSSAAASPTPKSRR